MKRWLLGLAAWFLCLMTLSTTEVSALSSGIEGESFDITITVTEDGRYHIEERLDLIFHDYYRGIYVTIPQRYEDYEFEGEIRDYFFPVTDIEVHGDPVDIERQSEGVALRIGDADTYLIGPKSYHYSYTINTRDLGFDGKQLFYLNLISEAWEFPFNQLTFRIEFPSEFAIDPYFYTTLDDQDVEYTVAGNVISGSYNQVINPGEAVSVWVRLPDDYFTFPNLDYTSYTVFVQIIVSVLAAVFFYRFGRDEPLVDSVEFTPPDGLNSAEVAYVYKGYLGDNDITSLIIYWASQGYLSIEELETQEIKLVKSKEMDGSEPNSERRIFKGLFGKKTEVTTKKLPRGFSSAVSYAKTDIPSTFRRDDKRTVFDSKASGMKVLGALLVPLGMIAYHVALAYSLRGYFFDALIGAVVAVVGFTVLTFAVVYSSAFKKGKTLALSIAVRLGLALVIAVIVALTIVVFGFRISLIVVWIGYVAGLVFINNTDRRTAVGMRWYGQILGLKRFIEVAEKNRLEALVAENPHIFYDILPFAYVLGVTDVWSKKFESIAIEQPSWYATSTPGSFNSMVLWYHLNRSMQTFNTSIRPIEIRSGSGGGGSFGGGGGSFGGGGSAGGGFGGSGGGGW